MGKTDMGGEYKKCVTLINKWGLHAKTAFAFAKEAMKYESVITVEKDKKRADGKRMDDLLMLCAGCGDTLVITAVGEDGEKALSGLATVVSSGFGEE
ncbi:MAG TPA: HPr family phosphocarrier protein [Nitrospirae bacterium]|nr:HPr family phosphocarrier protein [Nitrospirota bacterium]